MGKQLSDEMVEHIRTEHAQGKLTVNQISDLIGIRPNNVELILHGETYANAPGPLKMRHDPGTSESRAMMKRNGGIATSAIRWAMKEDLATNMEARFILYGWAEGRGAHTRSQIAHEVRKLFMVGDPSNLPYHAPAPVLVEYD